MSASEPDEGPEERITAESGTTVSAIGPVASVLHPGMRVRVKGPGDTGTIVNLIEEAEVRMDSDWRIVRFQQTSLEKIGLDWAVGPKAQEPLKGQWISNHMHPAMSCPLGRMCPSWSSSTGDHFVNERRCQLCEEMCTCESPTRFTKQDSDQIEHSKGGSCGTW